MTAFSFIAKHTAAPRLCLLFHLHPHRGFHVCEKNPPMKSAAALALLAGALCTAPARGQVSSDVVKIGILNDQSGLYADLAGAGSVQAARMAIEEFGGQVLGKKIELVWADHQNKADIGAGIARAWFDREGVDAIARFLQFERRVRGAGPGQRAQEDHAGGGGSSDFTGKACSPFSTQWVYNSYSNGYGLARLLASRGMDSVFLLTVDYTFGHAFANDVRKAVTENGGKVLGEVRFPLNSFDLSSYLLQAQASKAKLIVTAAAGSDMTSTVKQANEFGITPGQALAAPAVFITDVNSMGLQAAQGLQFVTAFCWDRTPDSRAWAESSSRARRPCRP